MHEFTDLADRAAAYALGSLNEVHRNTIRALDRSGATRHVKNLQMVSLSKAMIAVGMFSIFEAMLQDQLGKEKPFKALSALLREAGEIELCSGFQLTFWAINALKHGKEDSYDKLLAQQTPPPFRVKARGEDFFFEGDVSEINMLVEVTDEFVLYCAETIRLVSEHLRSKDLFV